MCSRKPRISTAIRNALKGWGIDVSKKTTQVLKTLRRKQRNCQKASSSVVNPDGLAVCFMLWEIGNLYEILEEEF